MCGMQHAIDIHVHIGPRWDDVKGMRASCQDLASAAESAGVSLSVASSAESLLSKTTLGTADDPEMEQRLFQGNEDLLRQCRDRPGLRMTVVVDPCLDASLRQAGTLMSWRISAGKRY